MEAELRELFTHLRQWVGVHRQIGLEPPPVVLRSSGKSEGLLVEEFGDLAELARHASTCTRCKLHGGRTRVVFGEGSPTADLVFVGEGPGQEEDRAGRPFVGEAGRLLDRILQKGMGLRREDVYICNVVKCRPPRNRDPEHDEIEACLPFLRQQLAIVRPKVICALGRVAAQALLAEDVKIGEVRGQWRRFEDTALMPTFHPAHLLHHPQAKRQVWDDVKQIMKRLGLEVPNRAGA